MKKATFISGPPGGGKWALAQQLAEPIKGNTLYISPVNINKNNLLNVLRTDDYQILFIDWPIILEIKFYRVETSQIPYMIEIEIKDSDTRKIREMGKAFFII